MKKRISLLLSLALLATTPMSFASEGVTNTGGKGTTKNITQVTVGNSKLPNPAKKRKNANNTLVVSMGNVSGAILPLYNSTTSDGQVVNLIFDSLYNNDEQGNYSVPRLAESYSLSEDKLTYTFKLRKNVKWSDGKPFTAKDVENTFLWLADRSYDGRYMGVAGRLEGYDDYNMGKEKSFKGVKVIDDYTIAFKCSNSNVTNFSTVASFPIMPAHIYKYEAGKVAKIEALQEKRKIVGSGRYILKKYVQDEYVELTANPNWFGGKVNISNLKLTFIVPDEQFEAFRIGDIDIQANVVATAENEGEIIDTGFLSTNSYPSNSYQYMGFNLRDERLKDVNVRQALTYGFNRQAFVDIYYSGNGQVCNVPIARASWAYTEDVNPYAYNPKKANQLLESAGWKKGPDGIRAKNGKKLSFIWDSYTDSKFVEIIIPMLKADWKKIGVKVEPNLMEFNALVEKVYTDRDFDMYNMAWSLSSDPSTRDVFHSDYDYPDGNNAIGLNDSKIDELSVMAEEEFDQVKRTELMHDYAKRINEILPYMFIGQHDQWDINNVRVKNFQVSPFCDWTSKIEQVELVK